MTADERSRQAQRRASHDAQAQAQAHREEVRRDPCPICHESVGDEGFVDREWREYEQAEPVCCCRRCWNAPEGGSVFDPTWGMGICEGCPLRERGPKEEEE